MRSGIILLAAILLMIANMAMCQENLTAANKPELNNSALKDIILSSAAKPDTYIFTFDANQRIEITNATANKTESQTISTKSYGVAALNLTAEAMKMALATVAVPEGQEENASIMATEMYLLNDSMYMKVDGNWTKIMLVGPSLENLWKQQNEMDRQKEELNNSTITFLGRENVNGIDCYKIQVVPDLKAYLAIEESYNIGIQGSQAGTSTASNLNLSSLFNNTNISEIMWISEDTHLPVKVDISMNMVLSPNDLGIPPKKAGDLEMMIDTSEAIAFSGFNRSINIVLPEEAKNAIAFPSSILTFSNASSMNSSLTNASLMNSSLMNSSLMNSSSMNSTTSINTTLMSK